MSLYKWNHNFPELARESGFTLREIQKNENNIDWRFIASIDPHSVVIDKEYEILDDCISHISEVSISFILNNRILDPAIGKYFVLSQYSMQYLLFCKKFLDKSINELRINLNEIQDENYKFEKLCMKQNMQILKLTDKLSIFDETSNFQCENCHNNNEKMSVEKRVIPTKDNTDSHLINTIKLELEVKQLKERLNLAEKELNEQKNKIDNKCNNCSEPPIAASKIPKKIKEFHNVAIQSNLEDEKEKSEDHLISKTDLAEILDKQSLVFDEWKANEHKKFSEQITGLKSQLNKTLELLHLKESKIENIEKQMELRNEKSRDPNYDDKVNKVSDKLESMCAHQKEMVDAIKQMDVLYADKIKTIEHTIEVFGSQKPKSTDDVGMNTSPEKSPVRQILETKPSRNSMIKSRMILNKAPRLLELNTSTSIDTDLDEDSNNEFMNNSRNVINVDSRSDNIVQKFEKEQKTQNAIAQSPHIVEKLEIDEKPTKPVKKIETKDVLQLFKDRMNAFGIDSSTKKLSTSDLELTISKLAERRETAKKKYKSYFILRNKLATDIDKIAREKHQNIEWRAPKKNLTINKNITKPRIPSSTSTPIVTNKKFKSALNMNVLPTKPKMMPLVKSADSKSQVPWKSDRENFIAEVLIHQQNITENIEPNNSEIIKPVVQRPTTNKGGMLDKILESPIRRLNSNSSIEQMVVQSAPATTVTEIGMNPESKQFQKKRVIFNLDPPHHNTIVNVVQNPQINDDSEWNISSFED